MRRIIATLLLSIAFMALGVQRAEAQHVVAVTTGCGMASARLYPAQESKPLWGTWSAGVSWRYYSMPRIVGCFGIDLEWIQRGFSYAPYASIYEDKKDYKYYTRRVNSIIMPIVWQPHVYMFRNHLRVYLEAAATFSYNFASTFENREPYTFGSGTGSAADVIEGKYEMRSERDNRLCFGLAGGGGIDLIFKQLEMGVRVRYDFGYSDILRNRNKYYDNGLDQQTSPGENPFWLTPIRSPLDNLSISLRIGYRIGKKEFTEWTAPKKPRRPKGEKRKRRDQHIFKYAL